MIDESSNLKIQMNFQTLPAKLDFLAQPLCTLISMLLHLNKMLFIMTRKVNDNCVTIHKNKNALFMSKE